MEAGKQVDVYRALIDKIGNLVAKEITACLSGSNLSSPTAANANLCSVDDCDRPARAKGLCSRHYQRQRYAEKKLAR